uniref:RRM domain-containing protein n=1 Tax=Alexandrium monilatum TaxID=311494 RepID=A0A7S4RM64_9DINO|mmetsp:Transcript_7604/g.24131  ORF Transcript_7604/g.24131 Transcript_7604/m.24131 type:complete len:418 (-) Transcript_7604:23-1276(-)
MAEFRVALNSPVVSVLDQRFWPIGNSFLNLVDSEEDFGEVVRPRSRSCPGMICSAPNVSSAISTTTEEPQEWVAKRSGSRRKSVQFFIQEVMQQQQLRRRQQQQQQQQDQLQPLPPTPPPPQQEESQPQQQPRTGLRSLPASSRPTSLVTKVAFQVDFPERGSPSNAETTGRRTDATSVEELDPTSPVSAKSRSSWADAWCEELEEEGREEEVMSPTTRQEWAAFQEELASPTSPTKRVWGAMTRAWQEAEEARGQGSRQEGWRDADITTLMIQNLPGNLTQRSLKMAMDNLGFEGQYDFLYLPTAFGSGASHGYAFVNFPVPASAQRLREIWDRRRPWGRGMEKPLHIRPAVLQGLEANTARWNSAKMRRVRNPEHRPMVLQVNALEDGADPGSPAPSDGGRSSTGRSRRSRHQRR